MTRLLGADISEVSKHLLPQWIEQIHRWGTTRYADAVARDVNLGLSSSSGAGTGGFGMMMHSAAAVNHDGIGDELPLGELESREWRGIDTDRNGQTDSRMDGQTDGTWDEWMDGMW